MTVIYLDELFLLNFVVDYLLLLAAGRLSGEILRRGWLALGAAIGAAYAAAAVLPGSDYGFGGAALIFLLYICRKKRALQVAALWLWCLWQYALELGSWEMFAFAAAAAIPMLLYNGRRGPGLKWLFYGFYPAHLLILGLYACDIWPWAA